MQQPKPGRAVLTRHVAPGVHRLGHAFVNLYLLEDPDSGDRGVTIVDAGLPAVWRHLPAALDAIGRGPGDIRALVLTHAHFDHIGTARRLRDGWAVPVWGHPLDREIAAHPARYAHERPRSRYPFAHPRSVPILARMARAGALRVAGVDGLRPLEPGALLPVPGRPRVVFAPGHTAGSCALHLSAADALLTGDALVTLDPYTGATGPRIVAGAATADSAQALASLDALAATGARILLPGHGDPWRGDPREAVRIAREAGAA